ncbi:MAG: hypothetical protein OJF50_005566 [Nitrospira sp.]|nr:hypothetical protein [Nitrospira sp.]
MWQHGCRPSKSLGLLFEDWAGGIISGPIKHLSAGFLSGTAYH